MRQLFGLTAVLLALPGLRDLAAQSPDSMPKGHQHTPGMQHGGGDSSFTALKERGRTFMGVDQDQAVHHFEALPDGGRIVLESTLGDSSAITAIRAHFTSIESAFRAGDFSTPMLVHAGPVPGTEVMAAKKDRIVYTRRDLPRGAELRLRTSDRIAVQAIHDFLAFQRTEHHAGGGEP